MPYLFEHASVPQINNALVIQSVSNSIIEFAPYAQVPLAADSVVDHLPLLEDREFTNILVQIFWDMEDV